MTFRGAPGLRLVPSVLRLPPSAFRLPSSVLRLLLRLAVAFGVGGSAALCVLCLTGCAGYQLGTGATPKFTTLFVAPVGSDVILPQARAELTTRLREAFIRDGRVRLTDSAEAADAVLRVTIASYTRDVVVSRTDDTGLGRRFDITLQARASLLSNRQPQPWFTDRVLEARRGAMVDSGLVPAEHQLLPVLGESLANEAVRAVLDTW
jgi:hypothetical protein